MLSRFNKTHLFLVFAIVSGLGIARAQEPGESDEDHGIVSRQDDEQEVAKRPCHNGFKIEPYLFATGDKILQVAWQYCDSVDSGFSDNIAAPVEVTLDKATSRRVRPRKTGKLWVADLPVDFCGDRSETVAYQVNGMRFPAQIERIPCPHSGQNAKFSLIADAQEGPEFVEMIARQIATFPGQAILSAGDLVQTGSSYADWIDYFNSMSLVGRSRVTFAAIGNHEYRSKPETNYWQDFFQKKPTEAYYSTWIGPVHLIVLNSGFEDDPSLIESQMPFLQNELAKPAAWKVVMLHHPPYSQGIAQIRHAPKKEHLILRERYIPLFDLYGVDLVLAGHTHVYERSKRNAIFYVTAGPAGGKMGLMGAENRYSQKAIRERTVSHFEANADELRMVTVDKNGEFVDSLRLVK